MWNTSNGYQQAVNFEQSLVVQSNAWFGVSGGKTVNVLWSYLNGAADWVGLLQSEVRGEIPSGFPSFDTLTTKLTIQDVNLIGNLTVWCVCDSSHAALYQGMSQ